MPLHHYIAPSARPKNEKETIGAMVVPVGANPPAYRYRPIEYLPVLVLVVVE